MDEEQKIYNKPVKTRQRVVMATVFIVVALVVACVVMCLPLLIDKAAKEAIIKNSKKRHATDGVRLDCKVHRR